MRKKAYLKIRLLASVLPLLIFSSVPAMASDYHNYKSEQLYPSSDNLHIPFDNNTYMLEELENAKNRILAFAVQFEIETAYVDENLNAVVIGTSNHSFGSELTHKLYDVAEIKKIYSRELSANSQAVWEEPTNEQERQLRIDGGRILKNKQILDVDTVGVYNGKLIVPIINMTQKKKEAVKAIAGKSAEYLQFVERNKRTSDFNPQAAMILKANSPYVYCNGLLIGMNHTPFMQDDRLMIPIRDIYDIVGAISQNYYEIKWVDGKDEIAILNYNYIHQIELSVKNNYMKCLIHNGEDVLLEGKAIIQDGALYIPYSIENTRSILSTNLMNGGWKSETKLLEFFS